MFKIAVIFLFSISLFAKSCIDCHQKDANRCKHSIHYTLKKAINITREIWGVKDSNVTYQTIPLSKKSLKSVSDLVDDFLRRKCLKCHVSIKSSGERGMKRGKNCLACHTKHQIGGEFKKSKTPMKKCLSCHNKEFIGTDYKGLFPKDYDKSYRAPLTKDGFFPPQKYGIDFHHLSQDIHFKKGLTCASCHSFKDMIGEKKVQCIDCHKQIAKKNHPNYHKNISCVACHSSWGVYSYELSVFRDDIADYKKWKNLTLQEDGYLKNFLKRALKSKKKIAPKMPDWVLKKMKRGIWYSGYRYRRWEDLYLANSKDGKVVLIRPLFQYRISYRDKNGKMIVDDKSGIAGKKIEGWVPYYPHTIGKYAKSCEECHVNPLIMDKNRKTPGVLSLKKPENIIGARSLTKEQIEKMSSKKYKLIRAKMFFNHY